jgi:Rod binding domain-containing protein
MSVNGLGSPPPPDAAGKPARELRWACHEMEGVFLRQLFQAMRDTVPQTDLFGNSPGQDTFTQLLDDRLAADAAQKMHRGLGEALYRQLSRRLNLEEP